MPINPKAKLRENRIHGFGAIGILAVIAAVLLLAGGVYFVYQRFTKPVDTVGTECTAEAKLCPDGSSVGRTGPNCEFAKCGDQKSDIGSQNDKLDTSTWKTYRNEKYGFEFSYPSVAQTVNLDSYGTAAGGVVNLKFNSCYIRFGAGPFGLEGEEDIQYRDDFVRVDGNDVKREFSFYSEGGSAVISLNYPRDRAYPLFLIYHSVDANCLSEIDPILSTFKFIK